MASTNITGNNNRSGGQMVTPLNWGMFNRQAFDGNVRGMSVSQSSTPNMTVTVQPGIALLDYVTVSSTQATIQSATTVALSTANTSNPRLDALVVYEDLSVTMPMTEPFNADAGNGRFKLRTIDGTPSTTPVAPTDAVIQSTIGSGNPFTRLANILVSANSTTIINSNIADERKVISPKIDFSSFTSKYLNGLSSTAIGTGGSVVGGSTRTFVAPFNGMCILRGSVPLRANSTATTDMTARFRRNGSDISGTNTLSITGRVISAGQTASMSDSSPYARFEITQGTSYTVTVFAQSSVNGSAAADGTGWYETELVSTEIMNTMI